MATEPWGSGASFHIACWSVNRNLETFFRLLLRLVADVAALSTDVAVGIDGCRCGRAVNGVGQAQPKLRAGRWRPLPWRGLPCLARGIPQWEVRVQLEPIFTALSGGFALLAWALEAFRDQSWHYVQISVTLLITNKERSRKKPWKGL